MIPSHFVGLEILSLLPRVIGDITDAYTPYIYLSSHGQTTVATTLAVAIFVARIESIKLQY